MIKSIYSQNLGSIFSFKKEKENEKISSSIQPVQEIQSIKNYSLENLKANYMPTKSNISFHGVSEKYELLKLKNGQPIFLTIPEDKAVVSISKLSSEKRIKGQYYKDLSDDLSVAIRSKKNVILEKEKGIEPEIFIHSFTKNLEAITRSGRKGLGFKPEIVYIKDPEISIEEALNKDAYKVAKTQILNGIDIGANQIINVEAMPEKFFIDVLLDIAKADHGPKIVFVDNIDKIINLPDESLENILNELDECAPNLSFIGLVKKKTKQELEQEKGVIKFSLGGLGKNFEFEIPKDLPKMDLRGLNVKDAKDFLHKNPNFIKPILEKYPELNIKITPSFIDEAVEKSAVLLDGAFPETTLQVFDMAIASKVNNSKIFQKNIAVTGADVKKLFADHPSLLDAARAESDRFKLAENIETRLKDVGGIGSIKEDIEKDLIAYLKNPKEFVKNGMEAPKGFLLEGPPGTGKTLLARAIAGESNTPFISASGSEFVQKYVGEGAARVRELFLAARQAAENSANKTAIVFIDEFDSLARQRSGGGDGGSQEAEQTLNQLLTEMDGFDNKASKTKIIVLAATNRKDLLDQATIRPGIFDSIFTIANPRTNADRLEILNIHAKKLKFANEADKKSILEETAKMTEEMSGAELANVLRKAQKVVSRRNDNKVITHNDIVEGFLQTIAGPIDKVADETPFSDIVKTVRHEGGHATTIDFLKPLFNEKISFITLDARGSFLGAVFHHSPKVNPNFKSVILSGAVSYAGGLAEPGFDNEGRAAGARQDLNNATNLFRRAVTEWGQGIYTPPIGLNSIDNKFEGKSAEGFYQTMRNANQNNINKDINLLSKTSEKIAKWINDFHKDFLDEYVSRFEENAGKGGNNLSGEEFSRLRQEWLVKTNKVAAEKKLLSKVEDLLDYAYNSDKDIITKLYKRIKLIIR